MVVSGQIHAPAYFYRENGGTAPDPGEEETGWVLELVWISGEEKNLVSLPSIEDRKFQPVTQWPHPLGYPGSHIHNVRMFGVFLGQILSFQCIKFISLFLAVCRTAKIDFKKKAEFFLQCTVDLLTVGPEGTWKCARFKQVLI